MRKNTSPDMDDSVLFTEYTGEPSGGSGLTVHPFGLVEPPHEVRDRKKLTRLVTSMEKHGWKGLPLIGHIWNTRAWLWVGSHRSVAAGLADVEAPVYLIDFDDTDIVDAVEIVLSGSITNSLVDDRYGCLVKYDSEFLEDVLVPLLVALDETEAAEVLQTEIDKEEF